MVYPVTLEERVDGKFTVKQPDGKFETNGVLHDNEDEMIEWLKHEMM